VTEIALTFMKKKEKTERREKGGRMKEQLNVVT
jgi:hypothetical protein